MLSWLKEKFGRCTPAATQMDMRRISASSTETLGASQSAEPNCIDTKLLKKALTQWRFGEWPSLMKIAPESLQGHPTRGCLVLLSATGHFQMGSLSSAQELIALASSYGCSKRSIARALLSGVHNALGIAKALIGDQEAALTHFAESLRVGDPGCDVRLLAPARANQQAFLYGLPQQGLWRSLLHKWGRRQDQGGSSGDAGLLSTSHIVIAGMRHSGSTALFNIVRIALNLSDVDFASGYSEHRNFGRAVRTDGKLRLIKTHEFREDVAGAGALILTSRRDLRDTIASAVRREFFLVSKLGGPVEYAKYNRMLHDIWQPYSDFEFEYESYMAEPLPVVENVLRRLGLDESMASSIQQQVSTLPSDRYQETLLSPTHITDPERNRSFTDTLRADVIERINAEHQRWLEEYGYGV